MPLGVHVKFFSGGKQQHSAALSQSNQLVQLHDWPPTLNHVFLQSTGPCGYITLHAGKGWLSTDVPCAAKTERSQTGPHVSPWNLPSALR